MANYRNNNFTQLTDKMAKIMENQIKQLDEVGNFVIAYGVPKSQSSEGASIEEYAKVNNYGSISKNIPARPFLSTVLANYAPQIRKDVKNALGMVKNAALTHENLESAEVKIILEKYIALALENYTKENLLNGNWQENAPATIKAKKSSKPLVDKGQLIQAIKGIVLDDKR